MNLNSTYLKFCRKFHNYKIPGIKFKELDIRIKKIYKSFYQIEEEDINKATLVILIISNYLLLFFHYVFLISLI